MENKRRSGRALVIQLGKESIRIAKTSLGASSGQFQAAVSVPTPEGAVEDGVIRAPEALREALRAALAAPELRRVRRAVFSLCTTQVISERVTIPAVPERRLGKLLESNMDLYFPVDTSEYRLVWQTVGTETDADGRENLTVQLWAVPRGMLARYYALANACGLSVAGIDYFGSGAAAAVGVSFPGRAPRRSARAARGAARRESARAAGGSGAATAVLERAETQEEEPTALYLLAEPEHLVMTFAREGQVKLQRVLQRGGGDGELTEAQMVLEYYRSMDGGRDSRVTGLACGALAGDGEYLARLGEALGLPVGVWSCPQGAEWCVCLGAARGALEFGAPEMNRPGGAGRHLGQAWQYALVLAGGAALALTLILTFGAKALWGATLDGLESTERTLRLQAAQNEGNANRYYEYLTLSQNYSGDWDALFQSLRTYNDNLALMLDELERVLPTTTSVTSIGIADEGLGLQFACSSKEEAAYLIMALRKLDYATLDAISDLTVGPGVSAQSMLPSLAAREAANAQALLEAQNAAGKGGSEEPPAQGSGLDLATLLQIMQAASEGSGSADYGDILEYALDNGLITMEDLEKAVMSLSPEELTALEEAYGKLPAVDYTMDELVARAAFEQRKAAMSDMLSNDPIAQYRFFMAFRKDITERPAGEEILFNYIAKDLGDNRELLLQVMGGDAEAADRAVPILVAAVTKDEETLAAAEELIRTDPSLARRYSYYLAVELGLQEKVDDPGGIDTDTLISDIQTGNRPDSEDPDAVDRAIDSVVDSIAPGLSELLPGSGGDPGGDSPGGDDPGGSSGSAGELDVEDLLKIFEMLGGSGNVSQIPGDVLSELLGLVQNQGGSLFPSTADPGTSVTPGGQTEQPTDERIYFSVALGYKPALIEAELVRKGLSYGDKLEQLEVLK